jgi:hypothetical protein
MKWTSEKPKQAGYYWYLGPVMKIDFDRIANGSDIRDCTWGPIIAGVGICLKEIPSGDGNPHHEKMWNEGRIVVEFYGSTVRRTLAEMPKEVFWAGPVTPPVSDWAWHLTENLLRGELLKRSLPYLEASLLGRLCSEMQEAHKNKALHKALEQKCSDLETLIEEIKETI